VSEQAVAPNERRGVDDEESRVIGREDVGVEPARRRRGWLVRRSLLAADVVGLTSAFFLTELLFPDKLGDRIGIGIETILFFVFLPAWIVAAKIYGLYDRDEERAAHSTIDELVSVFHLVTVGVWIFYALSWTTALNHPSQPKLATFWLLTISAIVLSRALARGLARRSPIYQQNAVILGAGDVGQLVGRKIVQHPEYGINLVGFVDAHPKALRGDLDSAQLLGSPEELPAIVERYRIDRVVVAFSNDRHEHLLEHLRTIRGSEVQIDLVPRLFDAVSPHIAMHAVEGFPLIGLPPARMARSSVFLKRCIDIVGASICLVLFAPLMAAIAVLIKRDSRGPVLYRQTRLGGNLRPFTALKFRTMVVGATDAPHREYVQRLMDTRAEPTGNGLYKLDRQDAVTSVGRFLRATSLDELPQLVNVLRGDMSLVGPRPCIPYETEFFEPHHFERFLVPAGLTGLWQVEARARSTFREALDLDVAYARGWSLGLDLTLLARTPWLLLRARRTG
jgi:exopolysaccharide biosynthesis polyprenyl glycosylphosphotransferase